MTSASVTPFIGRVRELDLLRSAVSGDPTVTTWLVGGDAGVGKTRLLETFAERVDTNEATVVRGACIHTAQGSLPFVAITEALSQLCDERDPDVVAEIVAARPELRLLLPEWGRGGADEPDDAAEWSQLRLFDAIAALLTRLSETRAVVVLLEDLHWAEQSTRDLLVYLALHLTGSRASIVATYRSDEMSRSHPFRPALAELDRSPSVHHLPLPPFDESELAELATLRLDERPTARTLAELAERSGGNAFFAAELLDALAAGRHGVRPELADLILARIERLSSPTREVLRLLSVGGESVRDELLEAVTDLSDVELVTALREALDDRVITMAEDGPLRFRHALMQEAVYATLLPRERQRAHARFAAALIDHPQLAAGHDGGDAELAWHLREAHQYEPALAASIAAAGSSSSLLAFSEALGHIESALELWDDVTDAEQLTGGTHRDLLQRAADLSERAGDFPRGVLFQQAAIDEATDLSDADRGLLHERLGRFLQAAGRASESLAEYERAIELVPEDPPTRELAVVLAGLGQQLMLTMQSAGAIEVLQHAIEIARRTGARRTEGHALNTLGTVLLHRGRHDAGIEMLAEALRIATDDGDPADRLRAYVNLTGGLTTSGNLAEAERIGREGVALAHELGHDAAYGFFVASNLCEALCELGRWDEATTLARDVKRPEGNLGRTWMLHHSVKIAVRRGDLDEARRMLDELAGDTLTRLDPQIVHVFWATTAEFARSDGDDAAARAALRRGLETADVLAEELMLRGRLVDLEVDLFETDGVDAVDRAEAELAAMASSVRDAVGEADAGPRIAAVLAEARAEVGTLRGHDATADWREAIERWDAGGFVWQRARALGSLGGVLLRQGDRGRATAALEQSESIAEELGARPLVRSARTLLRNAGLAGDSDSDGGDREDGRKGPRALTERELAVLDLVARGLTNRQIGEALFMSPKTASVHVSRILQKLDVSNRTEAASAARQAGLVP